MCGFDESTFGPNVTVTNNILTNVGKSKTHRSQASMYFHSVQRLHIPGTTWNKSAPLTLYIINGGRITTIEDIRLTDSGKIKANIDDYSTSNVLYK